MHPVRIAIPLLLAAAIGMAACLATVLAGRWATSLDHGLMRTALQHGMAAGAIPADDTPQPQGPRGPHPFNECLVYMMAALPSSSPWLDAAAPPAPARIVLGLEHVQVCPPLAEWARTDRLPIAVAPYGRYLQGGRLVAAASLRLDAVADLPILLLLAGYALLTAALVRNTWNAVQHKPERSRHLALAGIGAALLLFYGWPGFGRLVAHAPADLGLFTLLLAASGRDLLARSATVQAAIVAGFAAWAAVFEFLSGPLPMLLAFVLAIHAVSPLGRLRTAALAGAVVITTALAAFATKQAVLAMLGDAALHQSGMALARWLGPGGAGLLDALRWKLPDLYGCSAPLAYAVVAVSGLVAVVAAALLRPRARLPLLLAPLAVIVAWYALLPGHAVVHVNMMVRLTVWLPATAAMLAAALLSRPSPPDRSPAAHPTAR